MTKFMLILYLCTSVSGTPKCNQESIVSYQFANWSDCLIQGYRMSHNRIIEMYDIYEVNVDKLAIRFECKEFKTENT